MNPRAIQELREQIAAAVELARQTRDHRQKRIRRGYANQLVTHLQTIDERLVVAYHQAFEE